MIGDLHCHTKISDGSMSIDDVVFYAKRARLDFLAITDHDSFSGITRAAIVGKRLGINIVPGIELSCLDKKRNEKVHILCYNPLVQDRLEGICTKTLEARNKAGTEMLNLAMRYYPITAEHVFRYSSGSKSLYKAHIMQAIMDLGYTSTIYGSVYNYLFSHDKGKCYVLPEYPDVITVLETIREAKGIAVLAHPQVFNSFDLCHELCEQNLLDGIEAHHPANNKESREKSLEIAKQYDLIATGGTDFHGYYTSNPNPLGSYITDEENLLKLFSLIKKKSN